MNKKLYRSRTKRTLAGVCGGLEDYFNIDVTIIRLVWVLITIPGIVFGVLGYVVAAFIIPEEPMGYYDSQNNNFGNNNTNDNEYRRENNFDENSFNEDDER